MTNTPPVDDRATAAHELGHAFGLRAAGFSTDRIVVHKVLGGGYCRLEQDWVTDEQLWPYAVGIAAGRAGEELYREIHEINSPWSWGTGADQTIFDELHRKHPEQTYLVGGSWAQAVSEARSLLELDWDALDALVMPLASSGFLAGLPMAA